MIYLFFKIIYLITSFWLSQVFIAASSLSLVAASGGSSLVAEHGLQGTWASVVAARGLRCSTTHGISPDQGLSLCLLHWQSGS